MTNLALALVSLMLVTGGVSRVQAADAGLKRIQRKLSA